MIKGKVLDELNKIHNGMVGDIYLDEDKYAVMRFKDGTEMHIAEFTFGTRTRDLLQAFEGEEGP